MAGRAVWCPRVIAGYLIIAAGGLRAIGEVFEITSAGHSETSVIFTVGALMCFGTGLAGLWREPGVGRLGRVAIAATAMGSLAFCLVALWSLFWLGIPPTDEVARTPPFLIAALLTLVGTLALGLWLARHRTYPRWIGYALAATVFGSVAISFMPFSTVVQPIIDMVMALAFIQLGLSILQARKE
jgi:cytochrome bd-type quinol oxidase subunit 2